MYHYTFGSIFIYCYYNDVNFAELMGEVGEERESYLENAQFVSNDKSRKLICSIEYVYIFMIGGSLKKF